MRIPQPTGPGPSGLRPLRAPLQAVPEGLHQVRDKLRLFKGVYGTPLAL